ncbi:MAG: hypothetical protein JXR64_00660, partial [Spirochaetales bacterium]|nr:hypothetical protein [Spirochaetales bacterium]
MSSKKIISTLILFLISFNTMASNTKFTIPLKQWTYSNAYSSNMFDIEDKGNYIKTVKKADISIPSQFKNNKLYINSLKHTGFSKIYVNNKLIGDVGSLEKGKLSLSYTTDSLAIPPAILNSNGNNSIEIVTYRYYKAANPEWNISLVEKDNIYIKIDKLTSEIFPISFILICLIVIYTFFRFTKIGKDAIFFTLSVIFLIIFYGGATTSLNYLTQPFIIYAWLCLLFYFVIKNRAFSSKKIIQIGTIIVSGIVAFSILFMYNLSDFKSPFFLVGIVVLINSYFIYFIHRKDISNIKFINTGLIIGLVLNILTFSGSFGFYYMAQIIVLLSFIFNILSEIPQKMLRLKKYNTKLLDTLNKHKDELNKKDLNISSLKVENEEILREKSLFFSALSSNLRTPLNSIIGYSENLYSLENLDELHPLVTEIIIESDKIFQAINNIMDFSTRKFSNHELQLKDFRMKEIFDGSTYSSSTIAAFKKHIRY